MDLAKIRKALVAGGAAAVTAMVSSVLTDPPSTTEGWIGLVASALGVGVAVGWATWKVRNTGTVNGSTPTTGTTRWPAG